MSSTQSVWDDPAVRGGGDFVKFENAGDSIAGTVQDIRRHTFDDGDVAPQLLLLTDDGDDRTLTASQVLLKRRLAEARPELGDHITVTFTRAEPRPGGKQLKHFSVEVRRPGQDEPMYDDQGVPLPPEPPDEPPF